MANRFTNGRPKMIDLKIVLVLVTFQMVKQGNHRLHFARTVHSCHPFPPIGDAAYHQHAGGGPSQGHRQHAQKV